MNRQSIFQTRADCASTFCAVSWPWFNPPLEAHKESPFFHEKSMNRLTQKVYAVHHCLVSFDKKNL